MTIEVRRLLTDVLASKMLAAVLPGEVAVSVPFEARLRIALGRTADVTLVYRWKLHGR
jgi:hypothetical protein